MQDATKQPQGSKLWRVPHLHDLELLRGAHLRHSFPRHTHDRYAFGVIEHGALSYFYRGENVVALPGQINLVVPGEAHTGQPATADGWSYRMFYVEPALVQQIAAERAGRATTLPFFRQGAIADPAIAHQLRTLHRRFEASDVSLLELETCFVAVLGGFVERHAAERLPSARIGREPHAVARIKEYIEAHFADDIALDTLAALVNLSRFHLVRVFNDAVGVPPHTYLRQVRARHAKALLATGCGIADAALAAGFVDQSHLNRWFKRFYGYTPGQYSNSVQDTAAASPYTQS